jgi:hypothetical protein
MAASRHQLLDDALVISRGMADLAEQGEWQAVVELESKRRELLEQAFATHLPADEFVSERVRAILDLDKQLMERSLSAREQIAAELSASSKGRKAATAYQAAGR